jgi:hypothetical protein
MESLDLIYYVAIAPVVLLLFMQLAEVVVMLSKHHLRPRAFGVNK